VFDVPSYFSGVLIFEKTRFLRVWLHPCGLYVKSASAVTVLNLWS
jgi:hypothetical protein